MRTGRERQTNGLWGRGDVAGGKDTEVDSEADIILKCMQ